MTQPPALYALRSAPTGFTLGKFDADLNLLASYNLTPSGSGHACDCPASARSVKLRPCKHQRMLRFMVGAVNTPRFYEPESGRWIEPIVGPEAEPLQPQAGEVASQPLSIAKCIDLPDDANVAEEFAKLLHAGEGPGPSPLAADTSTSPSVSDRGQPAPVIRRRI